MGQVSTSSASHVVSGYVRLDQIIRLEIEVMVFSEPIEWLGFRRGELLWKLTYIKGTKSVERTVKTFPYFQICSLFSHSAEHSK